MRVGGYERGQEQRMRIDAAMEYLSDEDNEVEDYVMKSDSHLYGKTGSFTQLNGQSEEYRGDADYAASVVPTPSVKPLRKRLSSLLSFVPKPHIKQVGVNSNALTDNEDDSIDEQFQRRGGRRETMQDLRESLTVWKERTEAAELEKEALARDCDESAKELESLRLQLNTLKSTTSYLRSQLSDNEKYLQEAIAMERQKANEQLMRIKETMVDIVNRERHLMRREILKVRQMMATKEDESQLEHEEEQQRLSQRRATNPHFASDVTSEEHRRLDEEDDTEGEDGYQSY